jgi:CHAD domain-containing protein
MTAGWKPKKKKTLRENAIAVVPWLFQEFISHQGEVLTRPKSPEGLHKMRIAGKPLRYVMETFQPLFGPAFEKCYEEIKGVVERMGEIHDVDVAVSIFREHLSELKFFNRTAAKKSEKLLTRPLRILIQKTRAEREWAFGELEKNLNRWRRENFERKIREAVK